METEIRAAFYTLVKAFGLAEGLQYQYPNRKLPGDKPVLYLRGALITLTGTPMFVHNGGGIRRWRGSISVCMAPNTGENEALLIVDKLVALLTPPYLLDDKFTLMQPPEAQYPVPLPDGWNSIPVFFRFQTIA